MNTSYIPGAVSDGLEDLVDKLGHLREAFVADIEPLFSSGLESPLDEL